MGKYDKCKDSKLVQLLGQMRILVCILKKRHEGKHTDGKVEW